MYNVIIHINKSHDLPEAERAPFYLSVQIPEKCTHGNDDTATLPTIQMDRFYPIESKIPGECK